ncbi:protein-L-isoaspartate O-methyltransferase [Saccharopolyspora subtropica]|uniref:Protein-L-isoaspartate O-methyltransferase n=1 Tax=Saccharopolyspora thermophila TaxID=89367 RepID=A0A917K7G5_9PSEU|nr:ATP-grasp peptide maturase system methyltransferase [Saccharopolyspora subtropica]GGJ03876.1 protein-L-isoaspartate O-methyltransferase [Saccharopolyspora subtropica]
MTTTTETEALRARLVAQLTGEGYLRDPAWIAAFSDTPRGLFVPYYFEARTDRPGWRLLERSDEWRDGVYRNAAHITQIDNNPDGVLAARRGETVTGQPTSSSSAPSLMALMLEALDVHDGHRVLEIGTGSGYNAALLCHRLGSDHVASVDVDPVLVDFARDRLVKLGYTPHLAAVDGRDGCPEQAPFDRIIATVGVHRIPAAWIDQTRPGGIILAPLTVGGLLARLTVDDGRAEGAFLPDAGMFMPTRDQQIPAATIPHRDAATTEPEPTSLAVDVATGREFEFFAALHTGPYSRIGFTSADGSAPETWLIRPDGSWVCHTTPELGRHLVRQGGPARLWDTIERAHQQWQALGSPARDRFGLTVEAGKHRVWLDEPSNPVTDL